VQEGETTHFVMAKGKTKQGPWNLRNNHWIVMPRTGGGENLPTAKGERCGDQNSRRFTWSQAEVDNSNKKVDYLVFMQN